MDSCGAPTEMRRGSEEKLRSGESVDNLHGSAAKRTWPRRVNGRCGQRGGTCCRLIGLLQQSEA